MGLYIVYNPNNNATNPNCIIFSSIGSGGGGGTPLPAATAGRGGYFLSAYPLMLTSIININKTIFWVMIFMVFGGNLFLIIELDYCILAEIRS